LPGSSHRNLTWWRCSIIVVLPTLIVLAMASAVAFSAAVHGASLQTIDATATHEVRVRKTVTALTVAERKDWSFRPAQASIHARDGVFARDS
jgi:hypothetical protein